MLYEFCDTAFVVKLVRLFFLFALVLDEDPDSFVEKCFFTKPLREFFETIDSRFENARVRSKCDLRTTLRGRACLLQRSNGNSRFELHLVRLPVAPDLEL